MAVTLLRPNFRRPLLRTVEASKKIREAFRDEPSRKVTPVAWTWPKRMVHVGTCVGVMYRSDKWNEPREIDYKHNAEGPQQLYCRPGFLVDYFTKRALPGVQTETVELHSMPDSFAVLARIMGVQARLDGLDDDYQIDISGAWLGAAKHPETDQTFLVVYTDGTSKLKSEVHCIVTGEILGVEKDGIVG